MLPYYLAGLVFMPIIICIGLVWQELTYRARIRRTRSMYRTYNVANPLD